MATARKINGKKPRETSTLGGSAALAAGDALLPLLARVSRYDAEPGAMAPVKNQDYRDRLNLLYNVGKKVGSGSELSKLLNEIMHMTIQTLRASASSVFLLDRSKRELYFEVAGGEAGEALKQVRVSLDSGIVGWVARNVKPSISNNVSRDRRFNNQVDKKTGFVTRSVLAVPMVWEHKVIGVLEVLNKLDENGFDQQDVEVLTALASMAAAAISNANLHQEVLNGYKSTVRSLVAAIDAKDSSTCGHSQRVMDYVMMEAGAFSFSPEELQAIEFGGLLHDIGKIGIDDSILRKTDRLSPEEWANIYRHPTIGANIIAPVFFLEKAVDIIRYHHERYDGAGYPNGLKGEKIPIGARLVAVADAFDTMTTNRSYRKALGVDIAINELVKGKRTQFCPEAVEAFISSFKQRQKILFQSQPGNLQLPLIPTDTDRGAKE